MSKWKRIPKSISQKLDDLDAHLFIVREHLRKLNESSSHLKVLSAELRTLLCYSSRTDGLLWRLTNELGVDDKIFLHVPGDLDEDHPLAQGLQFLVVPIQRGGKGDPRLPPYHWPLKEIIKERQALVVGGKPFTHEYLIKAIAQQMGTAHEDDGLEEMLVNLKSIFINGVEPYIPVVATDAELTLEIGERVLELAEKTKSYKRKNHSRNYGDFSIAASLIIKQQILSEIPILKLSSNIGGTNIGVSAVPSGIEFTIKKHGSVVGVLTAKYPASFVFGQHTVFILSYCSRTKQARTIVDGVASGLFGLDNCGWVHAGDFSLEIEDKKYRKFIELFYFLSYEKLLSSDDSKGLSELPANGYGVWKTSEEIEERGKFPE